MTQEITIERIDLGKPILFTAGRESIGIYAGTTTWIGEREHTFETDTSIHVVGELVPGYDYGVGIDEDGQPFASLLAPADPLGDYIAGFHFAPSGCAEGVAGGDGVPAINPYSLWDRAFRPTCPDPRGMAFIDTAFRRFWSDIYLLGVEHAHGTSICGATIADGQDDLPDMIDHEGKYSKLGYAEAVKICTHHGKRLLAAEEFFIAAYGVKERCSRDSEPVQSGLLDDDAARFVSKYGLFDATGTVWQWGTDGHPDDPRPAIFGGPWGGGSSAGSRFANLSYQTVTSSESLGVRCASDHLQPV